MSSTPTAPIAEQKEEEESPDSQQAGIKKQSQEDTQQRKSHTNLDEKERKIMDEESKGTPLNNSKPPVVESVTGLTMTMIENYMDDHMNDYNSFENMNVTKYFDENQTT